MSDYRADGMRVLVTGGTSGLGAAMAAALDDAGAEVVVSGRSVGPATAPAHGRAVRMDVRDEASVADGVAAAVELLGGLDVLVNNAGIGMRTVNPRFLSEPQPFWQVPPDGFRDLVATNLTGYFLVARAAVPHLLESAGRLVTISMNHETMRRRGFVPYGPARAGAEALARIMAADLGGSGVTANILLPGGATATGMIPPGTSTDGLLPASVMGPPIRWLCSPAAAGVHDERIVATEFEAWLARRTPADSAEATTEVTT